MRLGDRQLSQWLPWHFDHCYNDQLNRAGVLRAVEVGVPGWPSWLGSWRDLREVRVARRIARQVIAEARDTAPPDLVIERHSRHEHTRSALSPAHV